MSKQWMGFGGIYFDDGVYTAYFPNAAGYFVFDPLIFELEDDSFRINSRQPGYRGEVYTDSLYTLQDDDIIEQTKRLAYILSGLVSKTSQRTVKVYPKYDPSEEINIGYDCILKDKISPKDVARVACGTKADLSWKVVDLIDTIPSFFSGESADVLVDESGNYLVDESGSQLADRG